MKKDPRSPLTAVFVKRVTKPGRYGDGGRGSNGLYLRVWTRPNGRTAKAWGQRLRVHGRETNLGLGLFPLVTLAEAREKALENRRAAYRNKDPRGGTVPTFEAAAETVIRLHAKSWKPGSQLPHQWRQTLTAYVFPVIGDKPVSKVTTADVLDVLTPIWTAKPATAQKVRQRVGAVCKWAVAKGYRADNPAGDAITAALPKAKNGHKHHRAVPHAKVRDALAKVREHGRGVRALALEFLVLTACRTAEVAGAKWSEIEAGVWTVPASRVKTKRAHRVPLSPAALRVLADAKALAGDSPHVFPGATGKPIARQAFGKVLKAAKVDGTAHGFRSSFRDWCGETGVAREVAERALAHTVHNRTEAAYNRTDLLDRRRDVMDDWAAYVAPGPVR